MKLLPDTDAYSAMRRGDADVERHIRQAEEIMFSVIVLGELLFGFRNGSRFRANLSRLESFLHKPSVVVLPVTSRIADRFGMISTELRTKGKPIPSNDIWIAAHALELRATLLSFDRHFGAIEGLEWIRPGEPTK
jgi:tRNA(fMet)-specific endonuclease VapC